MVKMTPVLSDKMKEVRYAIEDMLDQVDPQLEVAIVAKWLRDFVDVSCEIHGIIYFSGIRIKKGYQ